MSEASLGGNRELICVVQVGATTAQCFQFHAPRCDRVVNGVFRSLGWRVAAEPE
jgi:hypothetical protein